MILVTITTAQYNNGGLNNNKNRTAILMFNSDNYFKVLEIITFILPLIYQYLCH